MGASIAEVSARVSVTPGAMSQALSSFVRSILSGNSRFDRFTDGDRSALTAEEQAGLQVFRGKGNCVACHVGPILTDERVHNTGVAWRDGAILDPGAGRGDFKKPTLREIARTAPYMHDGSLATLEAVIEFYDGGGRTNPSLDSEIRPLRLTDTEKTQLAAFLRALAGDLQAGLR
jgi:cytochrome c peroxidase